MDMGNIVPRRRLRSDSERDRRQQCVAAAPDSAPADPQERRPAKGQLVAATQRSKPQPAGDDSIDFHNTENNQPVSLKQPTAKEMAAAKAARIRLGYEQADDAAGADELAPKLPDGPEPPRPEHVDYVPLDAAKPCEDVDGCLREVESGLQDPSWLAVCKALASLQQLTAHHQDALRAQLSTIAPLMVKHIQSLRSQVSKVAILCFGDLVKRFRDEMLPFVDGTGVPPKPSESALAQLLLKSVSKDKKFVLEASQKVLDSCAQTLEPAAMSHKLLGYLKHKNPNVRGAACAALSITVQKLQQDHRQVEQLARIGLLQATAALLSDKAPTARANSRKILALIKDVIAQTATSSAGEAPELTSEPSSDQENTITGNVSTGAAEAAAAAATAAAIENKTIGRSLSDPTGGAAAAWTNLCNEVLNASELMSVNRVT